MLELVLSPLVELDHHMSDVIWQTLIFDVVDHGPMNLIGHDGERLGRRRRRDLF